MSSSRGERFWSKSSLTPGGSRPACALVVELEHTVTALLAENRRLRLDPEGVALEAFDHEMDSRIEGERERA